MEIDVAAEVGRIRAARPGFIVLDPESTLPELKDLVLQCYQVVVRAPDGVAVFERSSDRAVRAGRESTGALCESY